MASTKSGLKLSYVALFFAVLGVVAPVIMGFDFGLLLGIVILFVPTPLAIYAIKQKGKISLYAKIVAWCAIILNLVLWTFSFG